MRDDIRKRIERSTLGGKKKRQRHPSYDGACVICGNHFKSDACPHSVADIDMAFYMYNAEVLLK
jgi:hypothetical protein